MNNKQRSNGFLSAFSMETALLLHAGVTISDGMHLLREDAVGDGAEVLERIIAVTDQGYPLSMALERAGGFPDYMVQMVVTGERSGRQEEALRALSAYYDSRQRLAARIRTALVYPGILAVLMLAVLTVLTVKVLPVFDQVYRQLGTRLTGLGGGLLRFGQGLGAALPGILTVLAVLVVLAAAAALLPGVRAVLGRWYRSLFGDRGILRSVAASRFASALSMGLSSGLPMDQSLDLAASFQQDNPPMRRRVETCRAAIEDGRSIADALAEAGILPAAYCRMVGLGLKAGAGDQMMREVAERLEEDAQEAIERAVGKVEPALVIVSCVLVGIVLLSVMLPLMNIMSSIG